MTDRFLQVLPLILEHEGGYVDDPQDPGGATNKGITIGTLSDWLGRPATETEVRHISDETVAKIYRKNYWDRVRADELPAGVDYCTMDYGVNSGPRRGIQALQRAVLVADDGVIGPITMQAVRSVDPEVIIRRMCEDRLNFMRRLRHWPRFGKGWQRRVEGVERKALAMAAKAPAPSAPHPLPPSRPEDAKPGGGLLLALLRALIKLLEALA